MYLIVPEGSKKALVVDPFDVVKLASAAKENGLEIGGSLLLTHHHSDHSKFVIITLFESQLIIKI